MCEDMLIYQPVSYNNFKCCLKNSKKHIDNANVYLYENDYISYIIG